MRLKTKILGLDAGGKPIIILNQIDADDLGIKSLGRVKLQSNKKELTAIVNITTRVVPHGFIGIYDEVKNFLNSHEFESITFGRFNFDDGGYVLSESTNMIIKTVENGKFVEVN